MFKLFENMKLYELNRVMRNSVEIHNLVKLTMDVLKKEIIFIHKEHKKVKSKPKIYKRLHGLYGSFKSAVFKKKKAATNLPNSRPNIHAKLPSRQIDPHEYPKYTPSKPNFGLDEVQTVPRVAMGTSDEEVKTISEFRFAAAGKTGYKIRSKRPDFFELGNKSDFQKVLSLIAIF